MYGLKIHLSSFVLKQNLVQGSDKIRFSISTIPDGSKEIYEMEAKKLFESHHFFSINITNETRKILFVFRKKSFMKNDPIIASTIVLANEFPAPDNSNNREVKTVKIFEPLQRIKNIYDEQNRKVLGSMDIRFEIAQPEYSFGNNVNIEKIHNGQGYSKVKVISHASNENGNENYSIFNEY